MRITCSLLSQFTPSRVYKWDVRFSTIPESKISSVPAPFHDWFPTVNCDIDLYQFNEGDVTTGGISLSYPSSYKLGSVSLTFIPDEEEIVVNWLEEQERLRKEGYTLAEVVVGLHAIKYTGDHRVVKTYDLIVYLASNVKRSWSSDPGVEMISVQFSVAGFLEKR